MCLQTMQNFKKLKTNLAESTISLFKVMMINIFSGCKLTPFNHIPLFLGS